MPEMPEEQVFEDYDPTSFLHDLPKQANPGHEETIVDVTAAVNAAVNSNQDMVVNVQDNNVGIDVINDDLDISDDSDEDQPGHQAGGDQPQPPPPSEDANQPMGGDQDHDDDGIWF